MESIGVNSIVQRIENITGFKNDLFIGGIFLMLIGGIISMLFGICTEIKNRILSSFIVSIEVKNNDESFSWLMQWLAAHSYAKDSKSLTMQVQYKNRSDDTFDIYNNKPKLLFIPAPGTHVFTHKGKLLWLTRKTEESKNPFSSNDKEIISISTFGTSPTLLKELALEAQDLALKNENGRISIFVPDTMSDCWKKSMTKTKRPLKSVILDSDLAEKIFGDARDFLESSNWYEERGLPYRRGYLFYGPPGCGKSSFLFALAGELNLNVCVLSISGSSMSDSTLNGLMQSLPKNAAVLLEDVDAAFEKRGSGEDKKGSITFSGLLNAIDGVASCDGRLLFMTTNHKEKLDAALIRPGRCDMQVYFPLASKKQIGQLFDNFYPFPNSQDLKQKFLNQIPSNKFSMAKLQGHFLNYKDQPHNAVENISTLFSQEQIGNLSPILTDSNPTPPSDDGDVESMESNEFSPIIGTIKKRNRRTLNKLRIHRKTKKYSFLSPSDNY